MRRLLLALAVTGASLVAAAPQAHAADPRNVKASWTRAWTGLDQPIAMAHPPGDSRVFIAERTGRIRVVRNGVLKSTPFLDLRRYVNTSGEGGLLSLAFKPDYKTTGRFFVAYTDANMTLRVRRFRATTPTSDTASTTGVDVISIPHPDGANHNGGQLAFGPGGYLFVGTGDGGGGGDPKGNAQNLNVLLGKILRLDVTPRPSGARQYVSPSTNPYYGAKAGRDEIWASGVRNPWRFSFDIGHNELWLGDVGQGDREEIDRWSTPGRNFGWDCREGTVNTASQYGGSYCKSTGYSAPIYEYGHGAGDCAIIGGYTYRGAKYGSIVNGHYLFGDYCTGKLWLLAFDSTGRRLVGNVGTFPGNVVAFGRDNARELYLLAGSSVYRMGFALR